MEITRLGVPSRSPLRADPSAESFATSHAETAGSSYGIGSTDTITKEKTGSRSSFIEPHNTTDLDEIKREEDGTPPSTTHPPDSTDDDSNPPIVYPNTLALTIILIACALSIFLIALDGTIISTAIPQITDDFSSIPDVGWYGSGFFMTLACSAPVWGKAYKYWSIKIVYIISVIIVEVGSLICGVAPNSPALIVGRAITGVGAAGISAGSFIIIGVSVLPAKVPAYLGLIGAMFSLGSVVGPLIGGVLTSNVTWRWCFYINLPIGGVTLLIILFAYRTPAHAAAVKAGWKEKLSQIDLLGALILLCSFICFVLALEWAGLSKPWSDPDVIGTLVGAFLLLVVFIAYEYWLGERAAMNLRLVLHRVMGPMFAFHSCIYGAYFVILYYLPQYFQVTDGLSASDSGVRTLPFVALPPICTLLQGIWTSKTKDYQFIMILGSSLATVTCGLFITLREGSSVGEWVGYQILGGLSFGLTLQVTISACQSVADPADLSPASALAVFFQSVGGTVWISVAQSVLGNELVLSLNRNGIDPAAVLAAGVTELRDTLPAGQVEAGIASYTTGLHDTFALCCALAGAAAVGGVLILVFGRRNIGSRPVVIGAV